MNTKMNKPFELKVIVAFEEVEDVWDIWGGAACSECAFHRVGNCGNYDCSGGVFKLIGVVEEREEEE